MTRCSAILDTPSAQQHFGAGAFLSALQENPRPGHLAGLAYLVCDNSYAQISTVAFNKEGKVWGPGLTSKAIWHVVKVVEPTGHDLGALMRTGFPYRDCSGSLAKIDGESVNAMAKHAPDQIRGKVMLVTPPQPKPFPWNTLAQLKPALVVLVGDGVRGQTSVHLRYTGDSEPPWLLVQDASLLKSIESANNGPIEGSITVRLAAPVVRPIRLCNVVAILPGSDVNLRDTCVLLTAHYDHVGRCAYGRDDPI